MALLVVLAVVVTLGEAVVLAAARFWTVAVGDARSTALVLITAFGVPKAPAPENEIGKIWLFIQYL